MKSSTSCGLYEKTDWLGCYCKNWNLRCNLNKYKIIVFKKGGKLKAQERWRIEG
jgi:hypothetical protein